ncbi:hypothetical protein C0995_014592 [Termitomyces sp. Mi166|nr:hypothetical protein C0995_014592 [Termitomyces sp. Mi166\
MAETAPTYNKLEAASPTEAIAEPTTTSTIAAPSESTSTSTAPPAESGATPIAAEPAPSTKTLPKPTPAAVVADETLASASTATSAPPTAPQDVKNAPDTTVSTESDAKDARVAEPQNTLTKQFTEGEWAALKEFRVELPEIFAEGFPDDPKASEKVITFWGVSIDPKAPSVDARVSVVLMKFLRARSLNVREARDMFVSTLRWRTSINIDAVLKEEFPEDVFGNVGHIFGHDHQGRPVVYNIYGGNNLTKVFSDTERFIRWRVALQEKSVALLDFTEIDQTVQIHDYLGVSLTSRDAKSKAAASEATNIFQSHYPELLHKKFFINVPTLMNWIFWVFKPLLPAATLAKMSVVGTGHHALRKALLPIIDAKELPKRYGGEAEGW